MHWIKSLSSDFSYFQIYDQGKSDKLFEYDHIDQSEWDRGMRKAVSVLLLTWIKEKPSSSGYNGGYYCSAH